MQRYDTYKDSCVKWLGEIPSHWEVISTKYIAKLYTGNSLNDASKEKYSLFSDDSYPYIASKDISLGTGTVDYDNGLYIPKDESFFEIAPKNSFLLCIEGGSAGRKKAFLDRNCCFVNKLCCFDSVLNPKYHYYFIQGDYFRTMFNCSLQGMIGGVSVSALKNFYTIVPPLEEQTAIASYLDTATAKIDAAIAQQQKMIDLLNERKQIIINRAVTKGLNPNAKMKDSGVEWIGEVPEGWKILALKYIIRPKKKLVGRNSKNYDLLSLSLKGIIKRDMDNPDGKWPASFDTYQEVLPGDFVFCNFDNEETPRAVGLSSYKGMITGAYDVMYCFNKNVDTQYLLYYLLYIDNGKRFKPLYKGLRKTVPIDSLMGFKIPIPPMKEQAELVNRLVSQTRKIDGIIQSVSNQISLLQERKQIIINEVVTGKVKVG